MSLNWHPEQFIVNLSKAVDAGATNASRALVASIVKTFGVNHGGVPSKPGQPPNTQIGTLRDSWSFAPARNGQVIVGSSVPYAKYLETGAIIRPVKAKALIIPMHKKASRLLGRDSGGSGRRAIDTLKTMGTISFCRSGRNQVVGLMKGRGKVKSFEAWFILSKGPVVIEKRPYVRKAIIDGTPQMLKNFVSAASVSLGWKTTQYPSWVTGPPAAGGNP